MNVNEPIAELVWAIQLRPDCLAVAAIAPDSSTASLGTAPHSHLGAAIAPIWCSCGWSWLEVLSFVGFYILYRC